MILDIGGGTSEVAVISLGGIVVSESIRVGGDEQDDAIVAHCKHHHKLLIGQQTAEEVKLEIGSATPLIDEEVTTEIRGRDLVTGLPKTIKLTSSRDPRTRSRSRSARSSPPSRRRSTGPRPSSPATSWIAGSRSPAAARSCRASTQRMRDECQMPCQLTESPLTCVAVGSGRSLEEFEVIHRMNRNRTGPSARRRRPGPRCTASRCGRRRAVLVALIVLSLVLLSSHFSEADSGPLHTIQRGVATVFAPVGEVAERALKPGRDLINWFDETFDARGENEDLQAEVAEAARAGGRGRRAPRATTSSSGSCSTSPMRTRGSASTTW